MQNQTVTQAEHLFSFRQQHPDCYYIGVVHSFAESSPLPTETELVPNCSPGVVPTFNLDSLFFTPAFVLPVDRDYYKANQQFQSDKFDRKIHTAEDQISREISIVVEPGLKFCQICRVKYEDYSSHLVDKAHRKQVSASAANKWIREMCSGLSDKEKKIQKQGKNKESKTQPQKMTRVKKKIQEKRGDNQSVSQNQI